MLKSKHCKLCLNQFKDPNSGYKCGLTNQKPHFSNKCDKIMVDEGKLYKEVEQVNLKHELVRFKKGKTIAHFIFFTLVAIVIGVIGYIYNDLYMQRGWFVSTFWVIMGLGVAMFVYALAPMNKYRQEITVTSSRKNELDAVLALYGFDYTIKQQIHKGNHDILEVETQLEVKKNGKDFGSHHNKLTIV